MVMKHLRYPDLIGIRLEKNSIFLSWNKYHSFVKKKACFEIDTLAR